MLTARVAGGPSCNPRCQNRCLSQAQEGRVIGKPGGPQSEMLCVFPLLSRRVVLVLEEGITFLTLEHFGQPGSGLPPVERLGQAHGGKRGRYGAPAHEAEERSEVSRGCEARHEQSSQA